MPRASRPWFRFYVEATRDPKMRRLTPAQRWLWVAVLSAARESCAPGYLMVSEDVQYGWADLADYAGMRERDVRQGIHEMIALGMVEEDYERGSWFVPHWNDRQFESDDVTARTQRHRNGDGSTLERSNSDVGNGNGTHQKTETDTETENGSSSSFSTPSKPGGSDRFSDRFDDFWQAYPRRVGKGHARKAFFDALKKTDAEVIVAAAERYAAQRTGQEAKFTAHPATWLNRERWTDELDPPSVPAYAAGITEWLAAHENANNAPTREAIDVDSV